MRRYRFLQLLGTLLLGSACSGGSSSADGAPEDAAADLLDDGGGEGDDDGQADDLGADADPDRADIPDSDADADSDVGELCRGVDCSYLTAGCTVGVCDPDSGDCLARSLGDGDPCDDEDPCTTGESCSAGACSGGEAPDCSAWNGPCALGRCDPSTGTCGAEPHSEGDRCDDGDPCSTADACRSGTCRGTRAGDTCAEPLVVPDGHGIFSFTGDTTCARDDLETDCESLGARTEVVYRLDLLQHRTVNAVLDGYRPSLELRGSDCLVAAPPLECDYGAGRPARFRAELEAGTYHLVVQTQDPGPYTLTLEMDAHDDCSRPVDFGDLATLPADIAALDDTTGATDDVSASCGGAGAADELYRFTLTARTLVRLDLERGTLPLLVSLARGDCAAGPLGARELACAVSSRDPYASRIDALLDAGDYAVAVDGVAAGAAGAYSLYARRLHGRLILIGHDLSTRLAAVDALLANAVALANHDTPVEVVEYVQYADLGAAGEAANARAALVALLPAWRTVAFIPLADPATLAAALAGRDVLLVHEQESRPSAPVLDAVGSAWGATLRAFLERGGVIVVLDSAGTGSWRTVASTGLLAFTAGGADLTGSRCDVVAAADPLARTLPARYTGPAATTAFEVTGGTTVVSGPAGERVVVHLAWP